MTSSEQIKLSQNIPRAFGAANRRGIELKMGYWGPKKLLLSLEITQ
jgi:hypothetical protein